MPGIDRASSREQLALFIDLDNFAGFCINYELPMDLNQDIRKLTEHGRVVIRKSFGDIYKIPIYPDEKDRLRYMLQKNLIQHEDVRFINKHKNSSDIKLVIEALSVAYANPTIQVFVVVADDKDYIPLFTKLREIGKTVIGIGSTQSGISEYYRSSCDQVYYHQYLTGSVSRQTPGDPEAPYSDTTSGNKNDTDKEEILALLIEATKAVENKGYMPLGCMIVPMMRALKSDLDFNYYGLSDFKSVCELAQDNGLVSIDRRGHDILVNCIDSGIAKHSEHTFKVKESSDTPMGSPDLMEKYKAYVQEKVKFKVPTFDDRIRLYEEICSHLSGNTEGVGINELSKSIAQAGNATGTDQPQIYKILYGLFRGKAFISENSDSPYDPIIKSTELGPEELDECFVSNLVTVFKRDPRNIPFDSQAWSRLLYGSEGKSSDILDMYNQ